MGANVVRALLARGRDVRAFVRETSDLRGLDGLDVEIARGDVLDADSLRRAAAGCEAVHHTAVTYGKAVRDQRLVLTSAMEGTRNVLEAAARAGTVRRVVHTSSVAAIGLAESPTERLDERAWIERPVRVYQVAKRDSERLAFSLAAERGLELVAVNPSLVFGAHDWKPTPANGVVLRFLRMGMPVWWEGGFNVVDVSDVALGHLLAEEKGRPGERYILGGENVAVRDLFRGLARVTGLGGPRFRLRRDLVVAGAAVLEATARAVGRAPEINRRVARSVAGGYAYYDVGKARRDLGYRPRPFRETLVRAVAWFLEDDWIGERRRARIRRRLDAFAGGEGAAPPGARETR